MTSTFARAQWTAAAATLAALIAMLLYPGGTAHDHATTGYTVTGNFLSDLGMTVAYDGQPNRIGAALFVTSIGLLVVGMGGALAGFVRLYASNTRARRFAYAAATAGAIDCACFIGVALTPENRAMALHVAFTLAAFRILPVAALLITLAAHATPTTPPRIVTAWAALTAVLIVYVVMLQGGAWTATAAGFVTQVIAQKLVAIFMVSVMVWQSHVATRMMPAPTPFAQSTRPT
jgi:hypothetical membrane protein